MKVSSTLVLLPGAGLVAARAMPADSIAPRQVAALNLLQSRHVYTPSCKDGKAKEVTDSLEACGTISTFVSGATSRLIRGGQLIVDDTKVKQLLSRHFNVNQLNVDGVGKIAEFFTEMGTRCQELRTGGRFVKCAASHKECAKGNDLYEQGKDIFLQDNVATVCPVMFGKGQSLCGKYGPLTEKFIETAFDAEIKRREAARPQLPVLDIINKDVITKYAQDVQMLFCQYKVEALGNLIVGQPDVTTLDNFAFTAPQVVDVQNRFAEVLADQAAIDDFVTEIDELQAKFEGIEKVNKDKFQDALKQVMDAEKAAAEAEAEDQEKAKDALRGEGQMKAKAEYDAALLSLKADYTKELEDAKNEHSVKYEKLEEAKKLAVDAKLAEIETLSGNITALTAEKKEIEANSTQTKLELEKASSDLMAAKQDLDDASKKLNETIEESRAKDNIIDDKTQQIKFLGETLDAERMHHDLRVQTDAQKLVDELEKKVHYLEGALGYANESLRKIYNALGGHGPTGGNGGGYGGGDLGGYGGGHDGKYPVEQIFNDDSEDCIEEEGDRNRHN